MKSILIATTNLDKFTIVKELFEELGLQDFKYLNLKDVQITITTEEEGTLSQRARMKANEGKRLLQEGNNEDIVAVIGIDDGMYLDKEKYLTEDSKTITKEILAGQRMQIGEVITIIRVYACVFLSGTEEVLCETRVPFTYRGNSNNVSFQEEKYPLSHVLGYLGEEEVVSELSEDKVVALNLRYSKESLMPLIQAIQQYSK